MRKVLSVVSIPRATREECMVLMCSRAFFAFPINHGNRSHSLTSLHTRQRYLTTPSIIWTCTISDGNVSFGRTAIISLHKLLSDTGRPLPIILLSGATTSVMAQQICRRRGPGRASPPEVTDKKKITKSLGCLFSLIFLSLPTRYAEPSSSSSASHDQPFHLYGLRLTIEGIRWTAAYLVSTAEPAEDLDKIEVAMTRTVLASGPLSLRIPTGILNGECDSIWVGYSPILRSTAALEDHRPRHGLPPWPASRQKGEKLT